MSRKREFRNWKTEVRTQMVDGKEKIVGYASVYNQLSEPMRIGNRTFRERVMPGAFDKCLMANPDIRGLFNHDPSLILGRTKSGTMSVSSDKEGFRYEIDPPNTTYANDLRESMSRGDVDQSSFGFYVGDDNWINTDDGLIRELVEVDCFDVSPVTYPAYTGSSSGVEMRTMFPDGLPESIENIEAPEAPVTEEKGFRVKIGDKVFTDLDSYKAARKEARAIDPDNDGDDDGPLLEAMWEVGMGCDLVCSSVYSAMNAFWSGEADYSNPLFEAFVKMAAALKEDLDEASALVQVELSEPPATDERSVRPSLLQRIERMSELEKD
jgi:HK97 family phage prohead protease